MKVLFLTPPPLDGALPAERIFGCNYGIYRQPNIFVLYVATVLKEAGHEVVFRDFSQEQRPQFENYAKNNRFDVVFFYTVFLARKTDLAARDIWRETSPSTHYVYLATEASAAPEVYVAPDSVAIRGEAESRVLDVLDAFAGKKPMSDIASISYWNDGQIIHTPGCSEIKNLDALPFPDRTLLGSDHFENPKLGVSPFTAMVASRGCSFRCYYCVPNSQSFSREIDFKRDHEGKPPVRLRSPENIVQECTQLAKAGYRGISFLDDQFVWGAERTRAICEGMEPLGLSWSCLARADMLQDRDVVMAMGKAGCRYIDIGIESFNQSILDDIKKDLKVEMVYTAVDNLKAAGIEPELNVLLAASPLETLETMEHTFQEVMKLDVDYVLFSVCTPFPYTEFNAVASKKGWMIKPEYEPIDPIRESFISYPHLTKAELDVAIRQCYRRFYFRPSYIWKRMRTLHGFGDFVGKARAAFELAKSVFSRS